MIDTSALQKLTPRPKCFAPLALSLAATLLLMIPGSAHGQSATGPLAPATPSDQPAASSAAAPQPSNLVGGKPNLAGSWKENKDQSDDPRQKMSQVAQNSGIGGPDAGGGPGADQNGPRGGGGGYGPGGFGVPGGQAGSGYPGGPGGGGWGGPGGLAGQNGGPNNGPADDPNAGPNGQRPYGNGPRDRRGDEFAQLSIEQTPTSVKVMNPSGRLVASYSSPDHAANSSSDAGASSSDAETSRRRNRNTPAVAQWQGDQLVAVSQTGGGTMTRTYELSPNGRQLFVTTKIENRRFKEPVTYRTVYDPVTVSNDGKNQ